MPSVTVLLSTPDAERFDAYCQFTGHKKSTLIARLIREHLDREGFASQPPLTGLEPSSRPAARRASKRSRT
jgi:hypothetical protein